MDQEISDKQISELCMFMRVIEVFKRNPHVLENIEMKQGYEELCSKVDEIMKLLTAEQLDIVLETHKIQLQEIAEAESDKESEE